MVHMAKTKIESLFGFSGKSMEETREIVTYLLFRDRFCCPSSVREVPVAIPKLNQVFWLTITDF
jgi:hypothetical protein